MSASRVPFLRLPSDGRLRFSPRRVPDEEANRPEQLVPIRLEFDVEHHKMRDTFVWNLNGTSHPAFAV